MTNRKDIWITGLGVVSAIGKNLSECLSSLRNDQTGIGKISYLDTVHLEQYVVGEVKLSNHEIASLVNDNPDLPRTTLLALLAAQETLTSANYTPDKKKRIGLILGTTVGGMDRTEKYYIKGENDTDYAQMHHCGFASQYIARRFGINAYVNTISTACSSGANAIMLGTRLIKQGILDAAIVGGTDALSVFTLNGFRSLMILDSDPCRPFSAERRGLNLGEGAGFVFIEPKEDAIKRNQIGVCRISGYSNANDAFHQTASSPDGRGAYKTMSEALSTAGINISEIDYINVHGTGTDNNDLTEGIAMKNLFGDVMPDFSSTKPFTGHCLGASGAIEAVFSASAIQQSEVYANLRFENPIQETGLKPILQYKKKKVRHVLSNSFGFGGCDTSLLFSEIE